MSLSQDLVTRPHPALHAKGNSPSRSRAVDPEVIPSNALLGKTGSFLRRSQDAFKLEKTSHQYLTAVLYGASAVSATCRDSTAMTQVMFRRSFDLSVKEVVYSG